MSVQSLLMGTSAYKIVRSDAERGALGHAYLLSYDDKANLRAALRLFARAMLCPAGGCGNCRICRLIERETFADCVMIPPEDRAVSVEDVDGLVADAVVRPLEGDRKLYVIAAGAQMNAQAQNKLLKTLEEPPAGVHILIGATADYALLPTVRSRVKKLEIPRFAPEAIAEALADECPDRERLLLAAAESGGVPGRAQAACASDKLTRVFGLALEALTDMQTSRQVLSYSARIAAENDFPAFLSAMKLLLRDILACGRGGKIMLAGKRADIERAAAGFPAGAALDAIAKINEIEYGAAFNANAVMMTDSLLFGILEGKYRWRKL